MLRMRSASVPGRATCALLLALLLALRLTGASGYMPDLDHGRLTIIVCPDADENAPLALGTSSHHHSHSKHNHGACPYAAAASLGALGTDWPPLLAILLFAVALLPARTFVSSARGTLRERPPPIGPPFPA